jgi:Na+/melibiose symporter-like transporter
MKLSLNPQVKKKLIRELVFNLGSIMEIVALYIAYLLGQDNMALGIFILAISLVINNMLSRGWLWLIKN